MSSLNVKSYLNGYLKFKQIMNDGSKGNQDVVIAFKDQDSGFGTLNMGYSELFKLDQDDLYYLLHKYKYLEDDSKVENIKKIEHQIDYNTEMWMNHSSEIDRLEIELRNIKK